MGVAVTRVALIFDGGHEVQMQRSEGDAQLSHLQRLRIALGEATADLRALVVHQHGTHYLGFAERAVVVAAFELYLRYGEYVVI